MAVNGTGKIELAKAHWDEHERANRERAVNSRYDSIGRLPH
jgi:hypothetical protein